MRRVEEKLPAISPRAKLGITAMIGFAAALLVDGEIHLSSIIVNWHVSKITKRSRTFSSWQKERKYYSASDLRQQKRHALPIFLFFLIFGLC